jgi:acyl-coenzyme A thioesterase PaaI-like protein
MLDDVMSYAGTAFLNGTHMLPTLEIKTTFIRPAPVDRCSAREDSFIAGGILLFLREY